MSPENSSDNSQTSQDIRSILEENNQLLKEVKAGNERLERYLRWNRIWSGLRLLIILIPILLGVLYLRPYAQNLFGTYQDLLGGSNTNSSGNSQSLDILEQLKQYQEVSN